MDIKLINLNISLPKIAHLQSRYSLRTLILSILLLISWGIAGLKAQRLSRDLNVDLLVNQVGFVPGAGKAFVTKGIRNSKFEVINLETQKVVLSGVIKPNPGDFGNYSVGDFSSLTQEGHYYLKSDTLRSYPFEISKTIYQPTMNLIVGYFSLQRCGSSTTGYLSPCHLDDGIRMDNGKHQDVSGGWHDASDLRKWVGATIYGMIGLGKTYDLLDPKNPEREKIIDELKWGNLYFLKMQEPEGYIMNFVGGDVKKHSDSNRWTDNEIGPEGGELTFVKPTIRKGDMLIFGTNDDRVIRTDPAGMGAQYNFITSEAIMARITKAKDAGYSDKCLQAAIKCFDWCTKSTRVPSAGTIGASIQASIEMYNTTRQEAYKTFAIDKASELKKLQAIKQEGGAGGFFYTSSTNQEPFKQISDGCLEFISICDLINAFPTHKEIPIWKEMISEYSKQYLLFLSQKNSFGIVPYGLFSKQDTLGNKKSGKYWYRYFMDPRLSWWVGINANLASAGVGLMKASAILNDPELKALAQKQLDWIIGANPFNSSTIMTVGRNQPTPMLGSEFKPPTPLLPGAVMNGLGGDVADQPHFIAENNYQQSEYWTPMVAYTIWLMAEISKAE
jgi:Glycosyl hydrolase family 9/Cellulase N-terminal ig-like domain